MPAEGLPWLARDEVLSFEEIERLVALLAQMGVEELRLTGGEPLVRRDFPRLAAMLAAIDGLRDLSLTTNGYLLERDAAALASAGIDRLNVSIDSLQRDRFFQMTRRDALPRVFRGLDAATREDAVPSGVGVAVAPDLRAGPAIQDDGRSVRAGAGQELARRSPGSEVGEAPQALYSEYLARLRQRVHESLRYPAAARRRGLAGGVTIELTILPSGAIRDVTIVESSSHPLLDQAALDTVRELRAQPFPTNVPPRTLRVRLPVVFRLE